MRVAALLQSLQNPALPGIDLSLDRVLALLAALGDPHKKLPPTIHVAGTNGKGSTIAFLRAMLEASGKRVHVYTSPELVRFNERIILAGKEITDDVLADALARVQKAAQKHPVTSFEASTAAAFLAFAAHPADMLLLETGMGGRLDATNVVEKPIATVITPIGLDHQEFLGNELTAIAAEKAGIMKSGVPCIAAEQVPEAMKVLQETAKHVGARLIQVKNMQLPTPSLLGEHQQQNAALAATALLTIDPSFPKKALEAGVRSARWPARLQPLRRGPLVEQWGARGAVVLDGGHNAHAARVIAAWAKAQPSPVVMVCGMMRRKDAGAFFAPLAGIITDLACVPLASHEAYLPGELAEAGRKAGLASASAHASLQEAVQALTRHHRATLVLAGSLVLAGQVLKNHE